MAEQENSKMLAMKEAMMRYMGLPDTDPDAWVLEEATQPEKLVEQMKEVLARTAHKAMAGDWRNS